MMLETEGGDSKEGIIKIDISDTQAEYVLAAKHLKGVIKVAETVRGHVVISECHKRNLFVIHQFLKMDMGDG